MNSYVADGYYNHRVIAFECRDRRVQADVGRLRQAADRREGAAAYDPAAAPSQQFGNPVHCVRMTRKDGLVHVCDRMNDRIQVFNKDGTLREGDVRRERTTLANGQSGTWKSGTTRSRPYLINADGANNEVADPSSATMARSPDASAATAAWPETSTGPQPWRWT